MRYLVPVILSGALIFADAPAPAALGGGPTVSKRQAERCGRKIDDLVRGSFLPGAGPDALLAYARKLRSVGRFDLARNLIGRAMKLPVKNGASAPLRRARALGELGVVAMYAGDFVTAIQHFRQALPVLRRAVGETHPDYLRMLSYHASALHQRGDAAAADRLRLDAIALHRRAATPDKVELAIVMLRRITDKALSDRRWHIDAAESAALEAIVRDVWDARAAADPERFFVFVQEHARLLRLGRRYRDAVRAYKLALKLRLDAVGLCDLDMAVTMNNAALAFWRHGELKPAYRLLESSLRLQRRLNAADDGSIAVVLANLAYYAGELKRHGDAERMYREAIALGRTARRGRIDLVPTIRLKYAQYLMRAERGRAALAEFAAAFPAYRRIHSDSSGTVIAAARDYLRLLKKLDPGNGAIGELERLTGAGAKTNSR